MEFDSEGHILISPQELAEHLDDPATLINDVLIPGTPLAFPRYEAYRRFLNASAAKFGIHPQNLLVRGSAKIGFSLSPDPDRIWVALRPDSDLDFAIIDPDYYHYLDREIRMYERDSENRAFQGPQFRKSIARQRQRAFYTYRYFDLPDIACVSDHNARLKSLPVEECCGLARPIDAFIFRDWWCLYSRWEYDIRDLRKALSQGAPVGEDAPRPYDV